MRSGVANSDILKSYLGLLCLGKNDFDGIENFRGNAFFIRALGLSAVPLSPTLRQLWGQAGLPLYNSGVIHRLAVRTCMSSLAGTKPRALGLSDHSLGLSCARPILTRRQAHLAFERPREIREVVEADGVSDFLGQCA